MSSKKRGKSSTIRSKGTILFCHSFALPPLFPSHHSLLVPCSIYPLCTAGSQALVPMTAAPRKTVPISPVQAPDNSRLVDVRREEEERERGWDEDLLASLGDAEELSTHTFRLQAFALKLGQLGKER